MTLPGDWRAWRERVDLDQYDERWRQMEATGQNVHGEADLVMSYEPTSVLDAGCGTGRVGIELARRGVEVIGTDLDGDLLARAIAKAPDLVWVQGDLAGLELGRQFDVVVLAGNVVPFIAADRRAQAVAACAHHLVPGGRLIAGFSLQAGWPGVADYDEWCAAAGLVLEERWATWDRVPIGADGSYVVSVHARAVGTPPTS